MSRSWLWIPTGLLIGAALSASFFVGLQFVVWGGTAPAWYAAPTSLGSMVGGALGLVWGSRRADGCSW